jgi:cytochrome o ubiquinol oxidase subunit III
MSSELLTIDTVRPYGPPPAQFVPREVASEHRTAATTVLGFWIYLMSDCLLFAALFAVYSVLGREFAGGPTAKELFDLPYVLAETLCLLTSSFTYGMVMVELNAGNRARVLGFLLLTFLLGLCFIGLEVKEFIRMVGEGAGPDRSAFLSAFFTLVGTHGLHVTSGLVWMAVMMVQTSRREFDAVLPRRLTCLSLFWHFLDIIWIGVFTVVYLAGAMS